MKPTPPEYVYVIVDDCIDCGNVCSIYRPSVYRNLEDAQKAFNEIVSQYKDTGIPDYWIVEEDSPRLFSVYEDGNYNNNHILVALNETRLL